MRKLNMMDVVARDHAERRRTRCRRLLVSAAPLALALASTSQAHAQAVTGGGQVVPGAVQTPDWTVGGDLVIGDTAAGTLDIEDGGSVTNATGYIGDDPGSQGTVTVSGQDGGGVASTWTNTGDLVVGQSGIGALTIDNGGVVSNQASYVGAAVGSQGTVTVSGRGANGDASTWTNAAELRIGDEGLGTLTIAAGGAVSAQGASYLGRDSGSQGTVNVSGQDGAGHASTLTNIGDFVVAQSGLGALTIDNGGVVSNQAGYVGAGLGSQGTVMVTGRGVSGAASTWTNAGDLNIGDEGDGELTIQDGGAVSNAIGSIGNQAAGAGMVTVSGEDAGGNASTWTSSAQIYVGNSGTGTLVVKNGGAVESGQGNIGFVSGGDGTATVSGKGASGSASSWTSANMYVGYRGTGVLSISDGGVVRSTGAGYIGANTGGDGEVTVSSSTGDTSTWTVTDDIFVGANFGASGVGALTVDKGGMVSAADNVVIADLSVGGGTVQLNGDATGRGVLQAGSVIKGDGAAVLDLNGGVLRAARDEADFLAGFATLAVGAGGGWFDTAGRSIGIATDFSGLSSIHKLGLGKLTLTGDSSAFTGDTTVSDGALFVGEAGAAALGGDVAVQSGAALGGTGTVRGNVTVAGGGRLSPGGAAAPGALTIDGDLLLSNTSVLVYRLGQAGTVGGGLNDLVVVGGSLTLDGTLNVTASAGGTFGPGVYRLISYGGGLTDGGLTLGSLPAGGTNTIQVSIANQVNLVNTAAPGDGGGVGGGPTDPQLPPPPPPPVPRNFWDGPGGTAGDGSIHGGDGTWQVGGPSTWTETNGATNGGFASGTFAIFGARPGVVTVDDSAGAVSVGGIQFASDGYRLTGDAITLQAGEAIVRVGDGTEAGAGFTATIGAELSGPGSLHKTDLGTLVLTGASSFTGGARVSSGTLQVDGVVGGALDVSPGGRLTGSGQVGATGNRGVIAPGRGGFGTLTIAGDYAGLGGGLEIETQLGGDASPTDLLVITGAAVGTTPIKVTNLGGQGAPTQTGIQVVRVDGASSGQFTLANGAYSIAGQPALVAGAYGYLLQKGDVDGNWYLRSSLEGAGQPGAPLYQPGAPVYEAYASTLLSLSGVSTLRQRVGDRRYDAGDAERAGVWARVEGATHHLEPSRSTSAVHQDIDSWKAQFGIDHVISSAPDGSRLTVGLTASLGAADTSLAAASGGGEIDTKTYGIGGALTWYGQQGAYIDIQAKAAWFDSDLTSNLAGRMADGQNAHGYGLGAEAGRAFVVGDGLSVTPQAQLSYVWTDFDRFEDRFAAQVSADKGKSLQGRVGLAFDHARSWQDTAGRTRQFGLYGLANLRHEFLDGTSVLVAGTPLGSRQDRTWAGIGLGGTYAWRDGRYVAYGEAAADTGLSSFGDSYTVTGSLGMRMTF